MLNGSFMIRQMVRNAAHHPLFRVTERTKVYRKPVPPFWYNEQPFAHIERIEIVHRPKVQIPVQEEAVLEPAVPETIVLPWYKRIWNWVRNLF